MIDNYKAYWEPVAPLAIFKFRFIYPLYLYLSITKISNASAMDPNVWRSASWIQP